MCCVMCVHEFGVWDGEVMRKRHCVHTYGPRKARKDTWRRTTSLSQYDQFNGSEGESVSLTSKWLYNSLARTGAAPRGSSEG